MRGARKHVMKLHLRTEGKRGEGTQSALKREREGEREGERERTTPLLKGLTWKKEPGHICKYTLMRKVMQLNTIKLPTTQSG